MFYGIGVTTVVLAVIVITYFLLKNIYSFGRKYKFFVRLIIGSIGTVSSLVVSGAVLLIIIGFGVLGDRHSSGGDGLHLPLLSLDNAEIDELKTNWPAINFDGFDTKIAQVSYGFTDTTTASVYMVKNPDEVWATIAKNSQEKKDVSIFYERMVCGLGGDLLYEWTVSVDHVPEFYAFCSSIIFDGMKISEIDFNYNDDGSGLDIRRIGKTNFFMISASEE